MLVWVAAMSWLIAHDVWPGVSAKDPPLLRVTDWLRNEGRQAQYAILDDSGEMGTVWTTYLIDANSILRQDIIWIKRLTVPLCPLRIYIDSTFTLAGVLDDFKLKLRNDRNQMVLHGERFHSYFSFELQMDLDAEPRLFKVPIYDGGTVAAAFSPLSQLSDLRVGQRWRVQVFNPVAALTGLGARFVPKIVEVTGEDRIVTEDGVIPCWVVQAAGTRAFVDSEGAVRIQELTLPVVGKIRVIRSSSFDEAARHRVQQWSPGERRKSDGDV